MVHKSKWLPLSLDVGDLYYELPVDMVTNTFLGRQKGAQLNKFMGAQNIYRGY